MSSDRFITSCDNGAGIVFILWVVSVPVCVIMTLCDPGDTYCAKMVWLSVDIVYRVKLHNLTDTVTKFYRTASTWLEQKRSRVVENFVKVQILILSNWVVC